MNIKKIVCVLLTIVLVLGVSACSSSGNGTIEIPSQSTLSGYQVVYPEKITGALHNPGMGWVALEEPTTNGRMDLGASGTLPEIDNIGIQTSWDLIETSPGVYDWSLIDKTIEYWASEGKKINFRICTDSLSLPEVYYGAPRWIYEEPYNVGYEEIEYSGTVNVSRVTDLTDPVYQEFFEKFLQELADRYSDNVYVETIDIRGFGQWGEWHSGHSFSDMTERMETLAYIVEKYSEAFSGSGKTLWLSNSWDYISYNDDGSSAATYGLGSYEDYYQWSSFDSAMKLDNVSFRRDGGAGNGIVKYATDEKLLADFFRSGKKEALCGEFFANYESLATGLYGMDPVEGVDDIIFKMRSNYSTVLGWTNIEVANVVEAGSADVFNRGNEKMGYRFAVDTARWAESASSGDEITVMTTVSNSGTGRFTLTDHKFKVSILDDGIEVASAVNDECDLRTIINGEPQNIYTTVTLPDSLSNKDYTVAVSIVDSNMNSAIRFGQEGDYNRRRYDLGTLSVKSNVTLPASAYEEVADLSSYQFSAGQTYTVTFEYTPSYKLSDYIFGTEDAFYAKVGSQQIYSWQDVSQEKSYKTVTFMAQSSGALTLGGTGDFSGKVSLGKAYIEKNNAYVEDFTDYDFNDLSSAFYPYYDTSGELATQDAIDGHSPNLEANNTHDYNDMLISDASILKFSPNTAYTVSFDFLSTKSGGNGAYMYMSLNYNNDSEKEIFAEWYNRPDEGVMQKSFTFITPNSEDCQLVFGMKNKGGYMIDNVVIMEASSSATILEGDDMEYENNVLPDYSDKAFEVEDFEDNNFNSSVMKYGYDRLGSLTTDADEVINGKTSFSSYVDPYAVPYYYSNNDCWLEFSYSNDRVIQFKANTVYNVTFKYKTLESPTSIKDNSSGYFYMLMRSTTLGYGGDSTTEYFGQTETFGEYETMSAQFVTGNGDDYKFIMGMYQVGLLIYDDIQFEEVGSLMSFTGFIDFESGNAIQNNVEGTEPSYSVVDINSLEIEKTDSFFDSCGTSALLVDAQGDWATVIKLTSAFLGEINTTYEISFDYYVISTSGTFMQVLMRPDEGYMYDAKPDEENQRPAISAGVGGSYSATLTTGDKSNYKFMIEAETTTLILIDNIRITKI